ncbi:COP9 signalosome complex subunit 4 [Paramecium bursaria]
MQSIDELRNNLHSIMQKGRANLTQDEKIECDILCATIYEAEGKRVQAAQLYYVTSIAIPSNLNKAVLNCLVSSATAKKYNLLQIFLRDKRIQESILYQFIQKNYNLKILNQQDINLFQNAYPFAQISDEFLQHNILASANYYKNISVQNIGQRLNFSNEQVYKTLEKMILEGTIKAKIDQIDGYVTFENEPINQIEHFCTNLYSLSKELK